MYVSSIDADGIFNGELDQEGALTGFWLTPNGELSLIANSVRDLENRASAVRFSPNGRFLVISSINAGSAKLASGSTDEIVVYGVSRNGQLSLKPLDAATSTLPTTHGTGIYLIQSGSKSSKKRVNNSWLLP